MRISDWSSDVCSSDLLLLAQAVGVFDFQAGGHFQQLRDVQRLQFIEVHRGERGKFKEGLWRRATDGPARYMGAGEAGARRSEERRGWNECVSTCRSRGAPSN